MHKEKQSWIEQVQHPTKDNLQNKSLKTFDAQLQMKT
jgi:hypothetical protein